MRLAWRRIWEDGSAPPPDGPVHVSMNDFWIPKLADVPRVALEGVRFMRAWPRTPGALGLWMASFNRGRRQVSVSIWRSPEALHEFVRTPGHRRVMRDYRGRGHLHTNAWTAEWFDRGLIWQQAEDRLRGRLPGVAHH